jgi:hypothetical protein
LKNKFFNINIFFTIAYIKNIVPFLIWFIIEC